MFVECMQRGKVERRGRRDAEIAEVPDVSFQLFKFLVSFN